MNDITEIISELRSFRDAREWQKYHSPKNLVMALAGEVGELITLFQWIPEDESYELPYTSEVLAVSAADVIDEIADVFIYLLQLADTLGIDVADAAKTKIKANERKYPVMK